MITWTEGIVIFKWYLFIWVQSRSSFPGSFIGLVLVVGIIIGIGLIKIEIDWVVVIIDEFVIGIVVG